MEKKLNNFKLKKTFYTRDRKAEKEKKQKQDLGKVYDQIKDRSHGDCVLCVCVCYVG
jgi:hypothetical protein